MRVYRNGVLSFVRKRLQLAYPSDWEERAKRPFAKEWDTIQAHARTPRIAGELASQLVDSLDVLGVNHFYNLFEAHYIVLFDRCDSEPEAQKRQRNSILEAAKKIKAMRDPVLGHPANEDIEMPDAIEMLNCAKRILSFIDIQAADRISEIQRTVAAKRASVDNDSRLVKCELESNLPDRALIVPNFVGRAEELSKLDQWFASKRQHIWMLAGDGGKGKTAIAYEFSAKIANEGSEDFLAVIWLSAKRRFHQTQVNIDANFSDLKTALVEILEFYGSCPAQGKETDAAFLELLQDTAIETLTQYPALIVLDDIDSLEGEGTAATNFFLTQTARTKSKFLFTSRRVQFGLESACTQIAGLFGDEGLQFIQSKSKLLGIPRDLIEPKFSKEILNVCDGSPLYIEDLLRLCKVGVPPRQAVQLWANEGGEKARAYALGKELDSLTGRHAKVVLLAFALSDGPSTLPEIANYTELSQDRVMEGIRDLQGLFLLPEAPLGADVPRFDLNFNTRQLVIEVDGRTEVARRIRARIVAHVLPMSEVQRGRIGLRISQARHLVWQRQFLEAEATLLEAQELFPASPALYAYLGRVYMQWHPPRLTDARACFVKAAELKADRADTYFHWWSLEYREQEYRSAADAALRGLEILPNNVDLLYCAGAALSHLGRELYQSTQLGRAKSEFLRATDLLERVMKEPLLHTETYKTRAKSCRSLAISLDHLILIDNEDSGGRESMPLKRKLFGILESWGNEYPNDQDAITETSRLSRKHGLG